MEIRRLTDLMAADELTLRFTPLGFGLDRKLTPESAAEVHQQTIASADLVDAVPGDVRAAFEDLRNCHVYGVLYYGFFTISANQSYVVLEQALRTRFVQFYDGALPVEDAFGHRVEIRVRNFDDVNEGFRPGAVHAKDWKLRNEATGQLHRVPLTLGPLLEWARRERLLDGQRAKSHENRQSQFRNWFVHGNQPQRGMPNDLTSAECEHTGGW